MILSYKKFNEQTEVAIKEFDRVIGFGTIKYYDPNGYGWTRADIENQTGIVTSCGQGSAWGISFDNYFVNNLTNLDGNIKFRRGLFVLPNQLEKVKLFDVPNNMPTFFSKKCKSVLEYLEYMDCPYYLKGINYVDITDRNDTVSYLSDDRIGRLGPEDDQWNNNFRQEMKIGKFIQILNPNTNQKSLDKKIDLFKAAHNGIMGKFQFHIVKGKEIIEWYNEDRYQDGTGSLNQSCMRNQLDRLTLYQYCDKISLLIMVNNDNKLVGRALLWDVDKPDVKYLDRPYVVYQADIHRFEDYARENKWWYWELHKSNHMVVHVGKDLGEAEGNPYMDTFEIFYTKGLEGKYYLANYRERSSSRFAYNDDEEEVEYVVFDEA